MGVTREEVIEQELLCDEVLRDIPEYCDCGAKLEFTNSIVSVYCPERFCYLKVAARLEAMAKAMEVDGWGEATCVEVCRAFKLQTPFQVFALGASNVESCNGVSAFRKKLDAICDPSKRKTELWRMVMYAGINQVQHIAFKIFDGYGSIEDAYEDIETYQVPFIANKLGIVNQDTGVLAVNIYNNLMEYKSELIFGQKYFEFVNEVGDNITIAITDSVSGYKSKGQYVKFLNNRYSGIFKLRMGSSVTSETFALISDGGVSSSKKYKDATKIQGNGGGIIITTSVELVQILDEKVQSL